MLKKCKDCKNILGNDRKTGLFWCTKCKEVKEEYDLKYKICILGKNTGKDTGKNNIIKKLGSELSLLGHEIIEIRFGELYDYIYVWNTTEHFIEKRKISLEFIDHIHSPDFIIVEQTYNRFDISGVNCPVIYLHREYTHFPDIEDPDMLLELYPNRLKTFEFYHPNQYAKIPYCDKLFVAVDPALFNPNKEKTIKYISMIGWSTNPYNFIEANGIWAAMVIEDQVAFYQECIKNGYVTYIKGGKFQRYRGLLEQCEAVLIDAGYVNCIGRRMFEAMASKTLCIIRVHNIKTKELFNEIGLTDEMCYFIYEPDDILMILHDWDITSKRRNEMVEKAYKWAFEKHTYKVRAKQLIKKFEDFKAGGKMKTKYMGYAVHSDIEIKTGKLIYREIV